MHDVTAAHRVHTSYIRL